MSAEKEKKQVALLEKTEASKEVAKKIENRGREKQKPAADFTRVAVRAVGEEQGSKYLALALFGLFFPLAAPAAWLLSQSLYSFAKTHDFLLDNKVYAAWVIGLVASCFYFLFFLSLGLAYLLVPGYSLV